MMEIQTNPPIPPTVALKANHDHHPIWGSYLSLIPK